MEKFKIVLITLAMAGFISCSDNSTGPDGEMDVNKGEGAFKVAGSFEAEHKGAAWYVGLRSEDGNFINLSINVSEFLPDETNAASTYSMSIRLVGEEGPFPLPTGQYEIGDETEGVLIMVSYSNSSNPDERFSYTTTSDASGTITVHSKSDTNIQVSLDVNLESGPTTEEGTVNVTGEINAECITAELGGFGC